MQGHVYDGFGEDLSTFLAEGLDMSHHQWAVYTMNFDVLWNSPELWEALGSGSAELLPPPGGLFSLFPQARRPPFRTLIIGGVGSHSGLHVDSFNNTGWNVLLQGRKLWRFWPPSTPAASLYAERDPNVNNQVPEFGSKMNSMFDEESLDGDIKNFPRVKEAGEPLEVLQNPGDVIMIPSGYWHQVYHLTPTLCFATNSVTAHIIDTVIDTILQWRETTWEACAKGTPRPVSTPNATEEEGLERAKEMIGMMVSCGLL